ncbi:UDP-glucuronosyltransferase 1-10 [Takifugu flavidus]|uniref:UDP-glucuronosyltransferase 1-10 n=1 Tax=Takifugu flavidus TaxID=433684 RepID=A0A5C6NL66_9TELE|nr:UDP-glucuronosyltransferase 1-10 [Takifugu flavidus]
MTEEIFFQGIQEVLNDPSYRMNMQRLSRLHRDAPMKPMDSALFWIEFVMRHKGAAHLRTESYRLPWYSYHSVDVMLFLAGITLLIFMTFAALDHETSPGRTAVSDRYLTVLSNKHMITKSVSTKIPFSSAPLDHHQKKFTTKLASRTGSVVAVFFSICFLGPTPAPSRQVK